jgi:hypothetical protein
MDKCPVPVCNSSRSTSSTSTPTSNSYLESLKIPDTYPQPIAEPMPPTTYWGN